MPIFEYACKECNHQFEALVFGKEIAECPKCHSQKLEPQLSVFAVSAKGSSSSSSPTAGPCGSCGDRTRPRCMLDGRSGLIPSTLGPLSTVPKSLHYHRHRARGTVVTYFHHLHR